MTEEPEKQLEEMEERAEEVKRDIEETEQEWESTQDKVPAADEDDQELKPLDEENPIGGS